jgi:hypothetical protein
MAVETLLLELRRDLSRWPLSIISLQKSRYLVRKSSTDEMGV